MSTALATEVIADGIYEGMSFEEYQADPALNGSSIMHMRRSPKHYRYQKDHPSKPSPAMEMGIIKHRMILEPELVGNVAVWGEEQDQKVRRGKVWDEFRELHKDDLILTVAELAECLGATRAALDNSPIRYYSEAEGPTELSLFWKHPVSGRRMKARIDKLIPATHTIFDLKNTMDCHSYRFGGQAYKLGYHMKLALYSQGYEILTGFKPEVRIGAVDSKPPHESAVYRVTHDVLLQGEEEIQVLIEKIEECEKRNEWPAEYDQETDLVLPSWAIANQFDIEDTL